MELNKRLSCFKAYDIRGRLDDEINDSVVYRIGRAAVQSLTARNVVIGFDARETSPKLARALERGICASGANVFNIGMAGTEEIYSGVSEFEADAGIEITASHNPIQYNGMKIVKSKSQPLSEKEFQDIKRLAEVNNFPTIDFTGSVIDKKNEARNLYLKKILSFVDLANLKPLKIVINSGNGAAGPTIDELAILLENKGVKINFVRLHHEPDSSFPNGIPNPLLKENRVATQKAVIEEGADFGVAFDGDFDRCFLFDNLGRFIPGEYMVSILAEIFLKAEKKAKIVHDPRVIWSTTQTIESLGGTSVVSKTGHAFLKASMRHVNAIYGGEMSAHHYFRDFYYCDSGIIPWLLIWELVSREQVSLSHLVDSKKKQFPSSGEINFSVSNACDCLKAIKKLFASEAIKIDELDGLSMTFKNWRFNLRKSNTEPLVRLNIETKGNEFLLRKKIIELEDLISGL